MVYPDLRFREIASGRKFWVEVKFRARTEDRIPGPCPCEVLHQDAALIMRIHIQNTLRDYEKEILSSKAKKDNVCGLTVSGMMRALGTLMVIASPGYTRLTSPSNTVREIFSLFGLEEPAAGMIALS